MIRLKESKNGTACCSFRNHDLRDVINKFAGVKKDSRKIPKGEWYLSITGWNTRENICQECLERTVKLLQEANK